MSINSEQLQELTEDEQEIIELLIFKPRTADQLRDELGRRDVVLLLNGLECRGLVAHNHCDSVEVWNKSGEPYTYFYCGTPVSEFFASVEQLSANEKLNLVETMFREVAPDVKFVDVTASVNSSEEETTK